MSKRFRSSPFARARLLLLAAALVACSSASHSPGDASAAGSPATAGANASAGSFGAGGNGVSGTSAGLAGTGETGGVATGGAADSGGPAGSGGGNPAPLFFDDFEAATLDTGKWTERINSSSKFDLDTSQKHGGAQSLHLAHSGFSTFLANEGAPIFPAPNNTFYGRLWLRVGGSLPQGHVVWSESGDVNNDTQEVRIGMNIGKFQSNLWPGDLDIRDPDAALLPNTWHCIQFKLGNDVLEVSLDGKPSSISTTTFVAIKSENGNTAPQANWSPTYSAFRIGWELGSGEIWYDDVALGHAPIACN